MVADCLFKFYNLNYAKLLKLVLDYFVLNKRNLALRRTKKKHAVRLDINDAYVFLAVFDYKYLTKLLENIKKAQFSYTIVQDTDR